MEGVEIFKKPDFVERWDAAALPRRALEKFRKSGADPTFAERRAARIASAIKNVREIEKGRSEST
jgi:DNA polymerase III alpha subunit